MFTSKITKEQLEKESPNSYSLRQLLENIGLVANGGNYITLKKYIKLWSIDTSHFTGQLWSKGRTLSPKRDITVYLNNEYSIGSHALKKRLIREGLLARKCDSCKLTEWLNKPIPLDLHHIDGNHRNNLLNNIQLLCPNCHSQTETHKGKNIGK